tara:strand:+ start:512 stop:772 length:261 start_codon:yes stop_codon:yes gene_type:complete
MANHQSAKKRIRQTERRTEINGARRSRISTYVRKVEEAIESGDKAAAEAAMQGAMPELHRGVLRGIMHKNTAARKISRLTRRIKTL